MPAGSDILPDLSEHAQRIVGESLNNITRHAQADQVWISVIQTEQHLNLEIKDDRQGFESDTTPTAGHYGLLGMRERVRLCQGSIDINSEIGRGTTIKVTLPLQKKETQFSTAATRERVVICNDKTRFLIRGDLNAICK